MFHEININTMTANALAPYITRVSATMVLTADKVILAFMRQDFNCLHKFWCWEMMENANISLCFLNLFSITRVKLWNSHKQYYCPSISCSHYFTWWFGDAKDEKETVLSHSPLWRNSNLNLAIFKLISRIDIVSIPCGIALGWKPQDITEWRNSHNHGMMMFQALNVAYVLESKGGSRCPGGGKHILLA